MVQVEHDAAQTKQKLQDTRQQLHIAVGMAAISQSRIAHLEEAVFSSRAAFESAEAEQQRHLQEFDRKLATASKEAAAVKCQFADRDGAVRAAFESAQADWQQQLQEADRQLDAAHTEIAGFEAHIAGTEETSQKAFASAQEEWQQQAGDAQARVALLQADAAEAQQRLSRATDTMGGLQRQPPTLRHPRLHPTSVCQSLSD